MSTALVVATEEGYWGEEIVEPLEALDEAGADVTVATPSGGKPVLDVRSADPDGVGEETAQRVRKVHDSDPRLADPLALREARDRCEGAEGLPWDAAVFPGGHGTVYDVNLDRDARALLHEAVTAEGSVALVVCHAAGILAFTRNRDGSFLVEGRTVTGFPNAWEEGIVDGADRIPDGRKLPYWVEDEVVAAGADWDAALGEDTAVRVDGDLITARGPASSEEAAHELVERL
jgi:putative intracellular protease/amidase